MLKNLNKNHTKVIYVYTHIYTFVNICGYIHIFTQTGLMLIKQNTAMLRTTIIPIEDRRKHEHSKGNLDKYVHKEGT